MNIVITGMGIVSPIGIGVPAFWEALCRGDDGIRDITGFPTDGFAFTKAGVPITAKRVANTSVSGGMKNVQPERPTISQTSAHKISEDMPGSL